MRHFLIFILFALTEYILRTFVESYKYHSVGLFLEFLPLLIATLLSGLFFKKTIPTGHFGWTYLKLITVSIAGLLTAKTFLFIQWYWFIAPEYRNKPGDMSEGFAWTLLDLIIGSIVIMLSYLVAVLTIKSLPKKV